MMDHSAGGSSRIVTRALRGSAVILALLATSLGITAPVDAAPERTSHPAAIGDPLAQGARPMGGPHTGSRPAGRNQGYTDQLLKRAPVPVLAWQPCGPDFPGAECAAATVPLDYDLPRRGTTEIALARIPASDRANRVGSVLVNPGGPGASGVALVLQGFGAFLEGQLDGRFDIVGFDPRGVAGSDPLHCFDSEDDLVAFLGDLPVFPYQRDQYRPFFERFHSLGAECLDDRQAVAANMNTADVARDLDLLRQAVGDRKLTYLGFSYGSYLGNTYANLFPHNIRALVIDGVLDPRLWSSGWQIKSDRVATQAEFSEFLRLCDEAGPACAFSSPGGSRARWEALARALRAKPLVLPDGSQYTYDFLIADATGAMYAPETWGGAEGAAALLDLLADAVLGDQAAAANAAAVRRSLIDRLTRPNAEADYDNGFDAYYGNQCADTQYPSSFSAFRLIDVYAAAGSRFGPYWWWGNNGCSGWPVNRDRYVGPWTARTSSPVLVVGNFFDGVTDHAGAEASARLLRNSRLLSYAGWGHTAYGRSVCVTEFVDTYLLTGSLPPAGTVCPANPNPFVQPALRTAAAEQPLVGLPPSWIFRS
jgi:pimeloyl-ACP methyl ester carboxylesterase